MSLHWVWHLCNLLCVSALLWLFSIARYVFRSLRICFWRTKYDVYCERVAYLYSISWRWARLWLELFTITVDKFFSRVSYLSSYVFLWRRRSFTSRKLYACLEKFFCFLQLSDRAYVSGARCTCIGSLIVVVPQDSNVIFTHKSVDCVAWCTLSHWCTCRLGKMTASFVNVEF